MMTKIKIIIQLLLDNLLKIGINTRIVRKVPQSKTANLISNKTNRHTIH